MRSIVPSDDNLTSTAILRQTASECFTKQFHQLGRKEAIFDNVGECFFIIAIIKADTTANSIGSEQIGHQQPSAYDVPFRMVATHGGIRMNHA